MWLLLAPQISDGNYPPEGRSTSKVLERINIVRLLSVFQDSCSQAQFGFQSGHSTLQQMLLFYHQIFHKSTSHQEQWDVVYLDFRKAFDTVSHGELLLKLKNLGVCGDSWHWLRCYLQDRQQCVCVLVMLGQLLFLLSQGCHRVVFYVGPLLFLVYINDLPDCVSSLLYMFADDVECAHSISSLEDCKLLQADLDSLTNWAQQWKMSFKESKCVVLKYTSPKLPVVQSGYTLNGVEMVTSDSCKDLGIFFAADLSFTIRYNHIISRAYRMLGLIRRTFSKRTNVHEKKLLYITLVRSQLLYCSVLWRPNLLKDIELLERVQRRVTKYILSDFHSDYRKRLLALNNLLPLMYVFELHDVMFAVLSLKSPHMEEVHTLQLSRYQVY